MSKKIPIFLLIAMAVAFITYISTSHLLLSLGILLIYIIVGVFFLTPKLDRYDKTIKRFHSCYHFINNFIISLSIKKAIKPSFENAQFSMDNEFQETMNEIDEMNEQEKIKYLGENYYRFHVYDLFQQIMSIYEEEGGDILEMSKYLLQECRNEENYLIQTSSIAKKKYAEVAVLWIITLAILLILRFVLKDFYNSIKNQMIYLVGVSLVMLFALASIYLLIDRGTKTYLKGGDINVQKI